VITLDEFVERLCRVGADRGPRAFPRKRRDRQILMKSLLMQLDSSRTYSEPEVNDAIEQWKRDVAPAISTDHVTIRRWLVDYGLLERTADGRFYRVGFPAGAIAFELEVEDVDVKATVAAFLDHQRRRRQSGLASKPQETS
jgi:hypothetical protein